MSEGAGPEYEQEIRFAVVMYGGVSLAIYINGVAQELLHMVRGTATLPDGEALESTEEVYRELGQILGCEGLLTGRRKVKPDSPIRSRFVVDIISGSSAGGINGVALAKALALKCRNMNALRKTWMNEAQLDHLLNDKASDFRKYPPADNRTTSLLNSERMYGKILETLDTMNDKKDRVLEEEPRFADKIDLFVTATDLAGLRVPIQLTGHKITERVHRTVFHFESPSPDNKNANEFEREYDPMLAFAARCTSSFPVAFEPMRFDRIATQIMAQRGLTLDDAKTKFKRFFPDDPDNPEDQYVTRQFADGGYLDNRPFSYVTDLIQYRSATRPTKRKLLFIDPFPELEGRETEPDREANFLENAALAAMTLPRYETIRGDIETINTYNRRLERLAALRERDEGDRDNLKQCMPHFKKRPRHLGMEDFKNLNLKQMVVDKEYGEGYPRYHHLRVYNTSDVLASLLTRLAGFEAESDEWAFIRLLLRAWRDEHYDAYKASKNKQGDSKLFENAFLVHFDVDFRLRRLNHLRVCIDKIASGEKSERSALDEKQLGDIRACAEAQLQELRDRVRELGDPTCSPLLEEKGAGAAIQGLRAQLDEDFRLVMNTTTYEERRARARETYLKDHLRPLIDSVMTALWAELAAVFDKNRKQIDRVLPYSAEPEESIVDIHDAFHYYHWHDFLSLPFLEGSGAKEYADVEVYRVSPADSDLEPDYLEDGNGKLVGTAVGAFGGFLQKGWREHDMMWGRLDGAERIITALMPMPDPKEPESGKLLQHYIRKAQDIILREEFSLTPGNRDRIFYWLAYKLREENVTGASAADLVRSGDRLLDNFPTVKDVISAKDFRTFLQKHYCPPPSPEPNSVADWSSRSLDILGRMIEDLPEGKLEGVRKRLARASRTSGALLTNLLRVATPGSFGKRIADRIWGLAIAAGVVLFFVGPIAGVDGATVVGLVTLAGCLAYWLITRTFSRWLKGKSTIHPAGTIGGVLIVALTLIGAWTVWRWVVSVDWGSLWTKIQATACSFF